MIVTNRKRYILLNPSKEGSVIDFYNEFYAVYSDFKKNNIIVDFYEKINIAITEILVFLEVSKQHRLNGMSFVIVAPSIDVDEIPDELVVVPTLTEAEDFLIMEDIQRQLDF